MARTKAKTAKVEELDSSKTFGEVAQELAEARDPNISSRDATDDEAAGLDSIPAPKAKGSPFSTLPRGWKPASEVLDKVTVVPTPFPDFNRATRVGGLPVRRIHTIHGPTHGGKSAFVGGLIKGFVEQGHAACYVDAEHATPNEFFAELLGGPLDDFPGFLAERPRSYEEIIEKVDSFLAWVKGLRLDPKNPNPDLCSIIVIDSINKLTPKRELKNILDAQGEIKKGRNGENGADELAKGHHARYRAALNQAWLDHLVPLLADANCAFVIIAQERGEDEDGYEMKDIVKVKGGAALLFDASILARVEKAAPDRDGDGKDAPIIGFRHRVRIWKSKVSHMDGRWTDCYFHLSNGVLTPAGFATARDALLAGEKLGILELNKAWVTWKTAKKRWNGRPRAVVELTKDRAALAKLCAEIDAKSRRAAS